MKKNRNIEYLKAGYEPCLQWLPSHGCFQIVMPDGAFVSKFVDSGKKLKYARFFARRYGTGNVVWTSLFGHK